MRNVIFTILNLNIMKTIKIPFYCLCVISLCLSAHATYVLVGESIETMALSDKTVRPLTSPYYHEDSFITSDLRAWYLNHDLDTLGGDVTVAALQIRLAITGNLQLVAYKDGYTRFSGGALNGNDGFNDIALGLKYAFVQDWENQFHLAGGLGYEFNWGEEEALQNTDQMRVWLSANKAYGRLHLGGTVNYLMTANQNQGVLDASDQLTAHFHSDYYLNEWLSPVFEINGYIVTNDAGTGLPSGASGIDAVSLGSGENNDVWTAALGAEVRPPHWGGVSLRGAYEREISDNPSIFDSRWTFSAVYAF
jgi:hypothetical protein